MDSSNLLSSDQSPLNATKPDFVSDLFPAYGGVTSDGEVVERNSLLETCGASDSIIVADEMFKCSVSIL